MIVIGLTGGSGVGKTTVMGVWAGLGAYCVDADRVYHRLLETDKTLQDALRGAFPDAFVSGSLDRKALGRLVFADPEKRAALERLTHGAVIREIEQLLGEACRARHTAAAVDALYLPDSPLRARCAALVGVVAPYEARLSRIMTRDNVKWDYAAARIAAQRDDAYFRAVCDYILENDAGAETLARRAAALYNTIVGQPAVG